MKAATSRPWIVFLTSASKTACFFYSIPIFNPSGCGRTELRISVSKNISFSFAVSLVVVPVPFDTREHWNYSKTI